MTYYSLDKKALGPVTVEQLHELFRRGVIGVDTLIIGEGARKWTTYRSQFLPILVIAESTCKPAHLLPVSADRRFGAESASPNGYSGMVKAGWILLGVTTLLAFIPLLGFGTWFIGGTVALVTITLAIITLARGGTRDGILLLLVTFFVFPLAIIFGPLVSTLTAASAASAVSEPSGNVHPKSPLGPIKPAQPRHQRPNTSFTH